MDSVVQGMVYGDEDFLGEVLRRGQVRFQKEWRRALAWGAVGTLAAAAALRCPLTMAAAPLAPCSNI